MRETLENDYFPVIREQACVIARRLQQAGYGLMESEHIDDGFVFTYVRADDKAMSMILFLPQNEDEQPDFVVMKCNPDLPMYMRGGSDVSFRTPDEAYDFWRYEYDGDGGYEIKPLINTVHLW